MYICVIFWKFCEKKILKQIYKTIYFSKVIFCLKKYVPVEENTENSNKTLFLEINNGKLGIIK